MLSVNSMYKYLLLPGLVGGLLTGCGDKVKEVASTGPRKPVPEESTGIESYMSEGGKIKGKLTAPYMLRYQRADTPYAEFPRSLHVDFYKDSVPGSGAPVPGNNAAMPGSSVKHDTTIVVESQMDARYGKYFQGLNKVFLRDSVVVKNILKGDTVYCKELWWDQQTQKFYTDKPVQIYTKDKILFGNGMDADQNFRWYTIHELKGSVLTSQSGMPK